MDGTEQAGAVPVRVPFGAQHSFGARVELRLGHAPGQVPLPGVPCICAPYRTPRTLMIVSIDQQDNGRGGEGERPVPGYWLCCVQQRGRQLYANNTSASGSGGGGFERGRSTLTCG